MNSIILFCFFMVSDMVESMIIELILEIWDLISGQQIFAKQFSSPMAFSNNYFFVFI